MHGQRLTPQLFLCPDRKQYTHGVTVTSPETGCDVLFSRCSTAASVLRESNRNTIENGELFQFQDSLHNCLQLTCQSKQKNPSAFIAEQKRQPQQFRETRRAAFRIFLRNRKNCSNQQSAVTGVEIFGGFSHPFIRQALLSHSAGPCRILCIISAQYSTSACMQRASGMPRLGITAPNVQFFTTLCDSNGLDQALIPRQEHAFHTTDFRRCTCHFRQTDSRQRNTRHTVSFPVHRFRTASGLAVPFMEPEGRSSSRCKT